MSSCECECDRNRSMSEQCMLSCPSIWTKFSHLTSPEIIQSIMLSVVLNILILNRSFSFVRNDWRMYSWTERSSSPPMLTASPMEFFILSTVCSTSRELLPTPTRTFERRRRHFQIQHNKLRKKPRNVFVIFSVDCGINDRWAVRS